MKIEGLAQTLRSPFGEKEALKVFLLLPLKRQTQKLHHPKNIVFDLQPDINLTFFHFSETFFFQNCETDFK